MTRLTVLCLVLVLLAGCGDDGATGASPSSTDAVPTSTTVPTSAAPTTIEALVPQPLPGGSLEVLVVGDSVMHDASAAIEAALTATGSATVRPVSAFGLGFSEGAAIPFAGAASDVLAGAPVEQVVVMVGSWDHLSARRDPEAYATEVQSALTTLAADGRSVLVLSEPPSDPAKGEESARAAVNEVLAAEAEALLPRVRFLVTDTVIGDAQGRFLQRDGTELLRKPDGRHLCPAGAARFGVAVLRALSAIWRLPAADPSWAQGDWRGAARYDDPPGGCDNG